MYQVNRFQRVVIWLFVVSQVFLPVYPIMDNLNRIRAQDTSTEAVPALESAPTLPVPTGYQPPAEISIWNESENVESQAENSVLAMSSEVVATSVPVLSLPPISFEPFSPVSPSDDLTLLSATNFDQAHLPGDWSFGPSWRATPLPDNSGYGALFSDQGMPAIYKSRSLGNVIIQSHLLVEYGTPNVIIRANVDGAYRVAIHETGQIDLYSNTTLLQSASVASFQGNWHTLLISVLDSDILVSVDGAQVIAYTDPNPLHSGALQIMSDLNGTARFWLDDLAVWTPQEEPIAPQDMGIQRASLLEEELLPQSTSLSSTETPDFGSRLAYKICQFHSYEEYPGAQDDNETYCNIFAHNTDGSSTDPLIANLHATSSCYYGVGDWEPKWSPDGTKIAYVTSVRGSDYFDGTVWSSCINTLNVIDTSTGNGPGTHSRILLEDGGWGKCVTWSPNSEHIAFFYLNDDPNTGPGLDDPFGLYMIAADGSQSKPTLIHSLNLQGTSGLCPEWSPTSDWIKVDSYLNPVNISLINAFSHEARIVSESEEFNTYNTHWSPDGTKLAFIGFSDPEPSGMDLWTLDVSGCLATVVACELAQPKLIAHTPHPNSFANFSWSPDSRQIAYDHFIYVGYLSQNDGIYIVDARPGATPSKVPQTGPQDEMWDRSPVWSPNGKWIALQDGNVYENGDTEDGVSVVRIDGSVPRVRIASVVGAAGTDHDFRLYSPIWQPKAYPISGLAIMGFGDARSPDAAFNTVLGTQPSVGKPVNPLTGNYTYAKEDLSIFAQGQTISFQRIYSTLGQTHGIIDNMGPGWTHTYNLRLFFDKLNAYGVPEKVTFQEAYGSRQIFTGTTSFTGTTTYTPESGLVAELKRSVDDQGDANPLNDIFTYQVITLSDHTVYEFNSYGYLKHIYPGGNTLTPITLSYASEPCFSGCDLASIEVGGRSLSLSYYGPNEFVDNIEQPPGYLKEIHDDGDGSVAYLYAPQGQTGLSELVEVKVKVENNKYQLWRYEYYGVGEPGAYFLKQVIDPLLNILEKQTYDNLGRVTKQEQGRTEPLDTIALFDYQCAVAELKTDEDIGEDAGEDTCEGPTTPDSKIRAYITTVTDGEGNIYEYTPDKNGTLESITDITEGRPGKTISSTIYNPWNHYRLTQQIDEYGYVTSTGWDKWGLFSDITDASGYKTSMLSSERKPALITAPRGQLTTIEYTLAPDALSMLPSTISTNKFLTVDVLAPTEVHNTTMAYYTTGWGMGQISDVFNPLIQRTKYEYYTYGQIERIIVNYENGVFDAQSPNQDLITAYLYDDAGRVIEIVDPLQRKTKTTYNAAGQVIEIVQNFDDGDYSDTEPDKDITTDMTYDGAGRLDTKTDTLGRVTKYVYSDTGHVTRVISNYKNPNNVNIDILSYAPGSPDVNVDIRYEYDQNGNVIATRDVLGNVERVCYDSRNRPVRTVTNYDNTASTDNDDDPCKRDEDDQSYIMQPGEAVDFNLITDMSYGVDSLGRRYEDVTHYLKTANTPLEAIVTRTVYDKLGRPIFVVYNYEDGVHEFSDHTVSNNEDPDEDEPDEGDAEEDADEDVIVQTVYDADGNVIRSIDPFGRETWMCYDGFNRLVKQVKNITNTAQSQDDLCSLALNEIPEQTSTLADANLVTRFEYDLMDRMTISYDTLGRETHYMYDEQGRVVKTISNYKDGVFNPEVPTDDVTRMTAYDPAGLWMETREFIVAPTDPITPDQYRATRYEYDLLGRQVAVIANYKDGNPEEPEDDPAIDVKQQTKYDGLGHVKEQIDASGNITKFDYDALGRLLIVTDADNNQLVSTYNGLGQLENVEDPLDQKTYFSYDKIGRQTKVWTALTGATDIHFTTKTEYNQLGQAIFKTDANGVVTAFLYDKLGRPTKVVENADYPLNPDPDAYNSTAPGNSAKNVQTAYEYNVMGSLTRVVLPGNNEIKYIYDGLDRQFIVDSILPNSDLWFTTYDRAGRVKATVDPMFQTKTFVYDELDRLVSIDYAKIGVLSPTPRETFTYDVLGRQKTMKTGDGDTSKTTYDYDELDRVTSVKDPSSKFINYTYYATGALKTKTIPNVGGVEYSYSNAGQLTDIDNVHQEGVSDWNAGNTHYEYDGNHLESMTLPNGIKAEFTYDTDNHIKTVTYKQSTAQDAETLMFYEYDYDNVGNRVGATEQIVEAPSLAVTSFTLVNADTGVDIRELSANDVIDLNTLPTWNLSVRANTIAPDGETVKSVTFDVADANSTTSFTDSDGLFAIAGNTSSGVYQPWAWASGTHTLTATPYTERLGNGDDGQPLSISFSVVLPACTGATIAAGDITTLNNRITAANSNPDPDVLCLTNGTYTFPAAYTGTSSAMPVITSDITIRGNGATIKRSTVNGTAKFRLFTITSSGNLKLQNLTLNNGYASTAQGGGGAIYVSTGRLTLGEHTQVLANKSDDKGGAIYNNDTLTLLGAMVSQNQSTGVGGAIYNSPNTKPFTMTDSFVNSNHGGNSGGGIASYVPVNITSSTVNGNVTAGQAGGGMYMTSTAGSSTITNSSFNGNSISPTVSGGLSGAGVSLNTNHVASVAIRESEFKNNIVNNPNGASTYGAGVYVVWTPNMKIADSLIEANIINGATNSAPIGGGAGLYINTESAVTITNSRIVLNKTLARGGGIYNNNSALIIDQSTVESNETKNTTSFSIGAGIFQEGSSASISINHSIISSNKVNNLTSGYGGGINATSGGPRSITNSCIMGNIASAGSVSGINALTTAFSAAHNWWGAANGPSGSGRTGSGDSISTLVNLKNVNLIDDIISTGCPSTAGVLVSGSNLMMSMSAEVDARMMSDNALTIDGTDEAETDTSPLTLPFVDEFELNDLWAPGVLWGTQGDESNQSLVAYSGPRNESSSLTLIKPLDLTTAAQPEMHFWRKSDLSTADMLVIEASMDGTTWLPVHTETNVHSDWTEQIVDLSAFSGQIVRLRFTLLTAGAVPAGEVSEGYQIDHLSILDAANGVIVTETPDITPEATLEPTVEVTPEATPEVTETPAPTATQEIVVPVEPTPLPAGSYEETDSNVRYAGSWAPYAENSLTYVRSTTPHDRMAFTFEGSQLIVYRAIGPNFGTMEVCFDLVCQTVSNENAEIVAEAGVPFSVAAGVHQAEVRVGENGDLRVNRIEVANTLIVEPTSVVTDIPVTAEPTLTEEVTATPEATLPTEQPILTTEATVLPVTVTVEPVLTVESLPVEVIEQPILVVEQAADIVEMPAVIEPVVSEVVEQPAVEQAEVVVDAPVATAEVPAVVETEVAVTVTVDVPVIVTEATAVPVVVTEPTEPAVIVVPATEATLVPTVAATDVIAPTATGPLAVGSHEETDAGIRTAGSWAAYAENGLSYIRSTTPHDRMAFTFEGTDLVVYRAIGPNFGTMEVCFDLVCQTVSNENTEVVAEAGVPFSVAVGVHQVEVRMGESGDLRVNRIEVSQTVETPLPVVVPTLQPTLVVDPISQQQILDQSAQMLAEVGVAAPFAESQMSVMSTGPLTTRYVAYTYDKLNRLESALSYPDKTSTNTQPLESYVYEYDLLGNRTKQIANGQTTTYDYTGTVTQLNKETRPGNVVYAYKYDLSGNRQETHLTDLNGAQVAEYTYDMANRLTTYKTLSGGNPVDTFTYTYNPLGDRLSQTWAKNSTSTVTNYLLDLNSPLTQVVGESTITGTTTSNTYYLDGVGQYQGSTWSYYGSDALGSVRQMTDTMGAVTYSTNYDPYGNPVKSFGVKSTMGFTGEQTDPNGLVYLRARYYDPMSGVFLSRDPVIGFPGQAMSYNGYSYVQGNPVNLTDPSGNCPFCIIGIMAGLGFINEWRGQVWDRQMHGISFWDAVSYRYLDTTSIFDAGVISGASALAGGIVSGMMLRALGVTAASSLSGTVGKFALSEVTGGVAARATGRFFTPGENALESLIDPGSMLQDAVIGGITGGVLKGVQASLPQGSRWAETVDEMLGGVPEGVCHSFAADTDVATPDGPIDISAIEIGDEVFAFNEKTGELGLYPVTATFEHLDPVIVELTIDDETITTTPGHRFYTDEGAWVEAADLVVGDDIRALDGGSGTVTAIETVAAQQWMYDLTVDEAHTFAVGDGEWVVHNTRIWCGKQIESTQWENIKQARQRPLPDPDLAELADFIEDNLPGRIQSIGTDLVDAEGNIIPHPNSLVPDGNGNLIPRPNPTGPTGIDIDILGDNFWIEVKGGNGGTASAQIKIRQPFLPDSTAIGFARNMGKFPRRDIVALGALAFGKDELDQLIFELARLANR